MRIVPGRKIDAVDAQWIAQLVEHGTKLETADVVPTAQESEPEDLQAVPETVRKTLATDPMKCATIAAGIKTPLTRFAG